MSELKALILADSVVDPIARFLSDTANRPKVQTEIGPYNQIFQILMDSENPIWKKEHDLLIIWTTPNKIISSYEKLLNNELFDLNELMLEVDQFAESVIQTKERQKFTFVVSWSIHSHYRNIQTYALKHNVGHANVLMQMNLRLANLFKEHSNIILMDSQYWHATLQTKAFDSKMYALGKIGFTREFFKLVSTEIKSVLRGLLAQTRKLIICDLDNTLWGGIIGDDGMDNILLGGIDPIGESFVLFQKELKKLKNRGIILAVCSKNEINIAMDMIERHPEMILKKSDFSAFRINWQDKAENVEQIVTELNLGLQSVVFLDDNPTERERIKQAFPEIYTPDLPKDITEYPSFIAMLDCFESPEITLEDRKRTTLYQEEAIRKVSMAKASSKEEWLISLDIVVRVSLLNRTNLPRVVQLLNKTNQFNMSTRRKTEEEYWNWCEIRTNRIYVFQIEDKFGNAGITGIISIILSKNEVEIIDFVMSCRIMGKAVEESMLYAVNNDLKKEHIKVLKANYRKTEKNSVFYEFIKHLYSNETTGELDINKIHNPRHIKIINEVQD